MTNQPQQLSLFSEENEKTAAPKAISSIKWSYSRRSTFERCLRQYYYEYFGSKKRLTKDEPKKEQIRFLNTLQARFLRAGEIVHQVIRVALQKAQQGEDWDAERIAQWGVAILRKDRDYSRRDPNGERPSDERYPPKLLTEYHYSLEEVEDLYDLIEKQIYNALYIYATAPAFEGFRYYGGQSGALIEERIRLKIGNCDVGGQVDLAYQLNDTVTIVDWKTGIEDGIGEDSLQLAVYALWALEHFRCVPGQMNVYKAFLGSGSTVKFSADVNILDAAKARILQDTERLAYMQDYGERGIELAFTPRYQIGICAACSFQRICYE